MSLLDPRDYYKPFNYPWAYDYYRKMFHDLHWGPHEAPLAEDVKDWRLRLKESEREQLTQLFRFFTQGDIDIARGYIERYLPRFPHPEIRMMLGAFVAAEANHIDAYAKLIETLGMPESEFQAFQNAKAMKDKHDYLFERDMGRSQADLLVDIGVFTAFGEGMQLFSTFALLMNYQRRGLMKGMTTIVEWSIRDESLHVEAMMKLFHTLVGEKPAAWNDETKKRIYDTARAMVKLEDAFIDACFSFGEVEGVTAEETRRYIRYIADRRLLQLGLKPNWHVKENPFPWLDWIMNAPTHTNFFEQRATEYGKGGLVNREDRYAFLAAPEPKVIPPNAEVVYAAALDRGETPNFRVYTKPGCPHCDRAKEMLDGLDHFYESVDLPEASDRQALFKEIEETWGRPGWNTSPMVFIVDDDDDLLAFVGGADDLHTLLFD